MGQGCVREESQTLCEVLLVQRVCLNLQSPPIVNDEFWTRKLGGDPGQRTQNVGLPLQQDIYDALLQLCRNHVNRQYVVNRLGAPG
jgi:hypothetical protein